MKDLTNPSPLVGMSVGIVTVSLSGGGAERQAALWAGAAAAAGAHVRVLALEDSASPYPLPHGVAVETYGKRGVWDTVGMLGALRRFARHTDVVAAFQPYVG